MGLIPYITPVDALSLKWAGTVAPLTPQKLDQIARNRAAALARRAEMQNAKGSFGCIVVVRWGSHDVFFVSDSKLEPGLEMGVKHT